MNTLDDYVKWMARSMGIKLNEDQLDEITRNLMQNEKYREALDELERDILRVWK